MGNEVRKARRFLAKECDICGAKYKVEEQSYPTTDRGEIECQFCGTIIHEWNGGRICFSDLVSEPTKEYKNKYEVGEEEDAASA